MRKWAEKELEQNLRQYTILKSKQKAGLSPVGKQSCPRRRAEVALGKNVESTTHHLFPLSKEGPQAALIKGVKELPVRMLLDKDQLGQLKTL